MSPKPFVAWACYCGSQTFLLKHGGEVVCSECYFVPPEIAHFHPDGKDYPNLVVEHDARRALVLVK